jgi:hypothetical protein
MKVSYVLAVLMLSALKALAQGTVSFANDASSAITNGTTRSLLPTGSAYTAYLFYAPDGTTNEAAFVQLGQFGWAFFGPQPGVFDGGTKTTPNTTAPGDYAMFQVRVWEVFPTSYEQALADPGYHLGKGKILRVKTGNPPLTAPGSLLAAGLQGFCVYQATLSVGDSSVSEGDAGVTNAVFSVRLARASSQTVSVSFATSA